MTPERPASVLAPRLDALSCPLCLTRVQRTETGTLADGMAEHQRVVHGTGADRG